jgi:hypothetical protein
MPQPFGLPLGQICERAGVPPERAATPIRIVLSGLHPALDIGFIETENLNKPELELHQLCSD